MSVSRVESRDVPYLGPTPPFTYYRCIKFDSHSEVELTVRKCKQNRFRKKKNRKEQNPYLENNYKINLSKTSSDGAAVPLGTVFFTILSGQTESFGIPINGQRLYSIDLDHRFVLQTFESGFELCFLIKNPENNILTSDKSNGQKNEIQFVQLKPLFTSYNLKNQTLDTQLLKTLIPLDSRITPQPSKITISCNDKSKQLKLGITTKCYSPKKTWIYQTYVKIAKELNLERKDAENSNRTGPNVIIVGPCDSGKSTLAKLIINYAINEQWSPMYVDLDMGQGAIGVPGMIGAGIIDQHCKLDNDYHFRPSHPFQVHFGDITLDSDKDAHKMSINCLAAKIENFLQSEEEQQVDRHNKTKIPKQTLTKWSGLVINTHGWVDGYGYKSTLDAIHKFSVSNVLVLEDFKLYERIHNDLIGVHPVRVNQTIHQATNLNFNPNSGTQVMVHFFKRNSSAVKRSSKLRCCLRMDRITRYFTNQMTTVKIPFKNHQIYRFYSWNRFSRLLKDVQKQNQNPNGKRSSTSKVIQAYPFEYKICKVEKADKNPSKRNYDRVVFDHLNRENIVQLGNRVLSVMTISVNQIFSKNCFSLDQLLEVRGYSRVLQINLEIGDLQIELPIELASRVCDHKLALLVNETIFDPYKRVSLSKQL